MNFQTTIVFIYADTMCERDRTRLGSGNQIYKPLSEEQMNKDQDKDSTKENSSQLHHNAAKHHEQASQHHKEAAKHHESGDHETAGHHAHIAHGHSLHASQHNEYP